MLDQIYVLSTQNDLQIHNYILTNQSDNNTMFNLIQEENPSCVDLKDQGNSFVDY